jgi:hypothetical protein
VNGSGRLITVGFWCTVLLTLGGLWLLVAHSWLGIQTAGTPWTPVTRNEVVTGAAVAAAGFAGLFAQFALGVRALFASAAERGTGRDAGPPPPPEEPR